MDTTQTDDPNATATNPALERLLRRLNHADQMSRVAAKSDRRYWEGQRDGLKSALEVMGIDASAVL